MPPTSLRARCHVLLAFPVLSQRSESRGRIPAPGRPCLLLGLLACVAVHLSVSPLPASSNQESIIEDRQSLDQFHDGRPLDSEEHQPLLRLLSAINKSSLLDIQRSSLRGVSVRDWLSRPAEHRGQIVALSGRVRHVTIAPFDRATLDRFSFDRIYLCQIELSPAPKPDSPDQKAAGPPSAQTQSPASDSPAPNTSIPASTIPATVYTFRVPESWKLDQPLDEPISLDGLLVKLAGEADRPQPIWAARHLAWHPPTVLGDLAMDVGLFDQVLPMGPLSQSRPGDDIQFSDRECFYQLLAAMGRVGTNELIRRAPGDRSAMLPFLQHPGKHAGDLATIEGMARRALLIKVEDADIVERFGIDHYYEIELSVNLEQPVNLDGDIYHTFPVVVCVRRLPPGMPRGERIAEPLRIPAFFLKVWTYRSQLSESQGTKSRQMAPLFIGRQPALIIPDRPDPIPGVMLATIFVILGLVLWALAWRWSRTDHAHIRRALTRDLTPPESASFPP